MRSLHAVLLCLLLFLPIVSAQQAPPGAPTFPKIESYALNKAKFTVPEDFAGHLNILVLLFERDQEDTARSWDASLVPLLAPHPDVKSYTLPIFGRVNVLSRWYLNASMRSSSPDSSHWAQTIPLYTDKAGLLEAIHVVSEKQIVLLIADKAGHIYWQASGGPSQENQAALAAALNAALSRH